MAAIGFSPADGIVFGLSRTRDRVGIGLWVVRRNVESVGGSVRAENRHDGPGLRVVMSFPAA